ncbi:MAG: hypothetical protein HY974_02805 [Candidatus Kerfeldbacteria bacterium]|nr:hypothetical protein [Candidatus Kerfeldbacteria bacterium]
MSSRQLINQLRELKTRRHAPVVWREQTKERLLNSISAAPQTSYGFTERLWLGLNNFRYALAPVRLVPATLTLLLVLFGAVPFTQAMNQSLPGNYLYALKRLSERTELSFRNTTEGQGVFYLKLASRRLAESAAVKSEPVRADLLRDYNINLFFAQASLQSLSQDGKLAATYDSASQTLLAQLRQLPVDTTIEPAYSVSLALTEKLSSRTLALLVNASNNQAAESPVTERLNQQIAKVQARLEGVEVRLVKLPVNMQAPRVVLEDKEAIVPVKEASRQAKQTLSEAKELVQKKEFTLALQKLEESETIALKSEAAVKKVAGDEATDKTDKTDKAGRPSGASTEGAITNDKVQTPNDVSKSEVNPTETKGQKVEIK